MRRAIAIPVLLLLLLPMYACHIPVVPKSQPSPRSTQFLLRGTEGYDGEFALALGNEGFIIKLIPQSEDDTQPLKPAEITEYQRAGYWYELKLAIVHNEVRACMLSDSHHISVVMTVVDIRDNKTMLTLKQVGPDHECPPQRSVWEPLAKDLRQAWLGSR